jgi:nicotinate-nucleotide pyrophosphorylase (carboxylating)
MVLLDNMDDAALSAAVAAVREVADASGRSILTEASGTITFERLAALRATGVDRVSTSVLTMDAHAVDFGFDAS